MSYPFRLAALRPQDLLALEFEFINLQPATESRLERVDPGAPVFVIIHFSPQHIAEKVFPGSVESKRQAPVPTAMAAPSRLVFRLPEDISQLPLTLEALLDWGTWEPMAASGPPTPFQTAIELPWRLILSPNSAARWSHSTVPITLDGNVEVWRTHITPGAAIHAVASLDGVSFPTSLSPANRTDLVNNTVPDEMMAGVAPIIADSLSLSALGASASLHGEWQFSTLRNYEHTIGQGRDHLVRTVRPGFLCGTGHRAVIVTTTERAPVTEAQVGTAEGGGALFGTMAYLHQRFEVIVEEPEIDYASMTGAYAFSGREMPLRSIRLITRSAQIQVEPGTSVTAPIWLMTPEGRPVFFRASALDVGGNRVDFELPLMFVPLGSADNVDLIRATYAAPPFTASLARQSRMGGQTLAMAPPGDKPGSTHVKADSMQWGLATLGDTASGFGLRAGGLPFDFGPRFLPYVSGAEVSVPAIEELLGTAVSQRIEHSATYLAHGFEAAANPAQTFARLVAPIPLDFASQRGGGLVRPSSVAEALSRSLGPIAAPAALEAGKIDLSAFAGARFLGTIKLLDLIPGNLPFDAASKAPDPPTQAQLDDPNFRLNQPRLITRRVPGAAALTVETRFLWKPSLKTQTFGPLTVRLDGADLLIDARTTRSASGAGTSLITGRLRRATLDFAGAISVSLGELLFRTEEGRKTEVGAKNVVLVFDGPLKFVNTLRSILPVDGFDDPPFQTIDGQGVVAGYTLGLPSVGVGIFSLQNIALTAAISIPFTDRPAGIRFAISERHKPFLVSVSLFGGGGFFALAVSANGLEQIEASIEFGGNIALNLFIASGGVSVMAGIYFALTAGSVTLTGFLRCSGYLEVLGLISVSVEFYLAFTYRDKASGGNEVWGQATVTVCVKIAFFSKSVSLSLERRFAGSDGDPSFAEGVSLNEWTEYLLAFA